jgi:hypothetical protein
MSGVNRWALRQAEEPSNRPNPGAGATLGRPLDSNKKVAMAASTRGQSVGDWHPTVVNLLVLIVLELVAYAALRYVFRSALGG